MAIRILTKNGVENTNIDGARDCNFNAGNRDGIVKSVLKEGNFFLSSSNVIALDTCELRIFGHRIVIDTIQYKTFSSVPTTPIRYALIGQIIMTETVPSFSLIVQYAEKILQKDNINNGNGTYEVEIGRFTLQPNGTIVDLVRTLDTITGGTGSGDGSGLEIGTVTTNTLDAGLDAEVDIENRYDEKKGKTVTDFTFSIPQGESPDMGAFEAKLNENIVKDPSKTYLVWKGAAFPNSSAADFRGTAGMIIDWGDGTVETFSSVPTSAITHSYTDGVEYHLIAIENLTALQSMAFNGCNNLIKVILGNTLTAIPINAFRSCQYLTEITIPDSVTKIESYAFYFCHRLENIQIPVSVLTIGDQAFVSCYRFTEIIIPDNVTSLGSSAFSDCTGLIEVTVSKKITTLSNTFYNCSSLVKIYMRRDAPPTITGTVLPITLSKVIVPKTAISYYKAATGWSNFANKIVYEVDSGSIPEEYPKKTDFEAVTQGRFYLNANVGLTIEPYSVYYIQCVDSSSNLADLTCVGSGKTVKGRFVFLITGGYLSNGVPDSLAIIQTGSIVISELVKTDANITSITPSSGNRLVYFKQGGKALKN